MLSVRESGVRTLPPTLHRRWATGELGLAIIFVVLNVTHGGVRLGRKVYLVDGQRPEPRRLRGGIE